MHARYYSPTVGRFLSVDPVQGEASNPQSWNRYSYVLNSPIENLDPTGAETAGMIIICIPKPTPEEEKKAEEEKKRKRREFLLWIWQLTLHNAQQTWFGNMWYGSAHQDTARYRLGQAQLFQLQMGLAFMPMAPEDAELEAESDYEASASSDITARGSRAANRSVTGSPTEFGQNLEKNGFTPSVSQDGKVSLYTKGNVQYSIRAFSKYTGGPTAEVRVGGRLLQKIRFGL